MFDSEETNPQPERERPSSADDAAARPQELVLVKKDQRYVFRCQPGEEASLLGQLRAMVDDPQANLSWFDAAVLSHQVGEQLAQRLREKGPSMP